MRLNVVVDDIQLYISKGATVHPYLYPIFLSHLSNLYHKNKVSLLPSTILELYWVTTRNKINNVA